MEQGQIKLLFEVQQKSQSVSKPSQYYSVRLIIRKTLRALLKIDGPIP